MPGGDSQQDRLRPSRVDRCLIGAAEATGSRDTDDVLSLFHEQPDLFAGAQIRHVRAVEVELCGAGFRLQALVTGHHEERQAVQRAREFGRVDAFCGDWPRVGAGNRRRAAGGKNDRGAGCRDRRMPPAGVD